METKKRNQAVFIANKGFTAIPNELILDKELSPESKYLYVVISSFSNIDDNNFPRSIIRYRTGYGINKFDRCLKELVDAKWIHKEQKIINNNFIQNIYKIVIKK